MTASVSCQDAAPRMSSRPDKNRLSISPDSVTLGEQHDKEDYTIGFDCLAKRRRAMTGQAHLDYAFSDGGAAHWLEHGARTGSSRTWNQLAPFGYAVDTVADRIVNIDGRTKYLSVSPLETVQINAIGKSVTWKFDTLGALLSSLQCNPGMRGRYRLRCAESNLSRGLAKVLRRSYVFVISASGTRQHWRRRMIRHNPDKIFSRIE